MVAKLMWSKQARTLETRLNEHKDSCMKALLDRSEHWSYGDVIID